MRDKAAHTIDRTMNGTSEGERGREMAEEFLDATGRSNPSGFRVSKSFAGQETALIG